ncbi:hypothetical protein RUM44_007315 [Polyplax serrata]|uniref:Uncharacterized protein n=1 Tax=Polyplax serrata TaxID=468196 RepID=A0ABR1B0C2_POLSC
MDLPRDIAEGNLGHVVLDQKIPKEKTHEMETRRDNRKFGGGSRPREIRSGERKTRNESASRLHVSLKPEVVEETPETQAKRLACAK